MIPDFRRYLLNHIFGARRFFLPPVLDTFPSTIDAPVATAATGVDVDSFTANWNAVDGATGYYLDVATDSDFTSYVTGYQNLSVAGTSKSVTGLSVFTTYYYRVRATNGSTTSENSNTITRATDFDPTGLDNLTLWSKYQNLARTAWEQAGYQYNNEASANELQGKSGGSVLLNGSNSDYLDLGNQGTIKLVEFWIKLGTTTEKIIDLNGTANIEAIAGTLTVNSWAGTTITIDGAVTSTIGTDWAHVLITSSTGVAASAVKVGLIGATYGDFSIKDIRFYSAVEGSNYNTPQNLLTQNGAVYPCMEGNVGIGTGAQPIIFEKDGNHGTFNTSAAGNYIVSRNNAEVGLQQFTHGKNFLDYLDGVDDDVDLGSVALTATAFVEFNTIIQTPSGTQRFFSQGTGLAGNNFGMQITSARKLVAIIGLDGGGLQVFTTTGAISEGQHKIKMEVTATDIEFYVDDALFESTSLTTTVGTGSHPMFIGTKTGENGEWYEGFIWDVNVDNQHSYLGGDPWTDLTGSNNGIRNGNPVKIPIPATSDAGTTDILGNTIADPWAEGKIDCRMAYGQFDWFVYNGGYPKITLTGIDLSAQTGFTFRGKFRNDRTYHPTSNNPIIANLGGGTNRVNIFVGAGVSAGKITFQCADGAAIKTITGSTVLNHMQEYEVIATAQVDGANLTMEVYIDGSSEASGTFASTEIDLAYLNNTWQFGYQSGAQYFVGLILDGDIYDDYTSDGNVSALSKVHGYTNLGGWVDDTGSIDGVPTAAIFKKAFNIQLHNGLSLESNLGNIKTPAFGIRVPDASDDQTIFTLGSGEDITLGSSAIVCSDFSSIVVDGSGNSISDDTRHYVELQNATDVNIDTTDILSPSFFGELWVPFIAYSDQLSAGESANLKTYVDAL